MASEAQSALQPRWTAPPDGVDGFGHWPLLVAAFVLLFLLLL